MLFSQKIPSLFSVIMLAVGAFGDLGHGGSNFLKDLDGQSWNLPAFPPSAMQRQAFFSSRGTGFKVLSEM